MTFEEFYGITIKDAKRAWDEAEKKMESEAPPGLFDSSPLCDLIDETAAIALLAAETGNFSIEVALKGVLTQGITIGMDLAQKSIILNLETRPEQEGATK